MFKYVTKTTKEYVYDEQGRVKKEIITEEYTEQKVVSEEGSTLHDPIKKAVETTITSTDIKKSVGVPYTGKGTQPWTVSYDSTPFNPDDFTAKTDANGVTHNITVNTNVADSINTEELTKAVKKAIDKANKLNGLIGGSKF